MIRSFIASLLFLANAVVWAENGGIIYHGHGHDDGTFHFHLIKNDPEEIANHAERPARQPVPAPMTASAPEIEVESEPASDNVIGMEAKSDPDCPVPVQTSREAPTVRITAPIVEPEPEPIPLLPLRVTEYMVRDWSHHRRVLPQWIELHNPNSDAINLKGYTFQYATPKFATNPSIRMIQFTDFVIPANGVSLLVTHQVGRFETFDGLTAEQVYDLKIPNALKRGWVFTDADGQEIYRVGKVFGVIHNPIAPLHQGESRVSHNIYASDVPLTAYFYGHRLDVGSPGFYEQPVPEAPTLKRPRFGLWAASKTN